MMSSYSPPSNPRPHRPVLNTFLFLALLASAPALPGKDLPPDIQAASDQRRAEIPLGGNFQPSPEAPVFVAVGHGPRVLISRDDGKTWDEAFFGFPGSDHSAWATRSVAISDGLLVVPTGWYGPSSYLASEDGKKWHHLTDGATTVEDKEDPTIMPPVWGAAGGNGTFVFGGYVEMVATPDMGKTWHTFNVRSFRDDPRPRKLSTHHVTPLYCGDATGRFLALGNDRAKENKVFGNLFATDDQGVTWRWLEPELLNEQCEGYSGMESNGQVVVLVDKRGQNAFRSLDAGETWEGPFPTGIGEAKRATLSRAGNSFTISNDAGAAGSADGKTWHPLPDTMPEGKIAASPEGTLIALDRQRILRSTDQGETWEEVYAYEIPEEWHVKGGQHLRDLTFGYLSP